MPRAYINLSDALAVPVPEVLWTPYSHVLTKSPGAAVNASWPCQNSGGGSPSVQIRFEYDSIAFPPKLGTNGPLQVVAGGSTVTLFVDSGIHPGEPNGVTLPARITMFEAGQEANPFATHAFTINTPPIFLVIVSQAINRLFTPDFCLTSLCFEWIGSVRNDDPVNTRYFRPTRTETAEGPVTPGTFIRRLTQRTIGPGATVSWKSTTSTAATRVFGEMWVEEYTSGGVFIQDILPKKAYDVRL